MTRDPMLDCITRYSVRNDYLTSRAAVGDEPFKGSTDVVLFSDLPALLAAARAEAAEAAMQIGRQIEKDNHAAGLCEPSYTHGREYQQERLTNHDMHSGLACLTNYEQGYAAALGKSREAVAPFVTQDCGVDDCTRHYSPVLAAIDALAAGQAPAEKKESQS